MNKKPDDVRLDHRFNPFAANFCPETDNEGWK